MVSSQRFSGVVVCLMLSGMSALLYAVVWTRQFTLVFGAEQLALQAVFCAFMGGLAIGAFLAKRFLGYLSNVLRLYGYLQLGILFAALLMPFLISGAGWLIVQWVGGQTEPAQASVASTIPRFLVSFILLLIPTSFMGASLPLLSQFAVSEKNQIGSRIGVLYGAGVLGGVFGVLLTAYFLIPALGLRMTGWMGVLVNGMAFLIAHRLAQSEDQTASVYKSSIGRWHWVMPITALTGLLTVFQTVFWTRLLSHVLGTGLYAQAGLLAVFLLSFALGSVIAARFAVNTARSVTGLVVAEIGVALCVVLAYQMLPMDVTWQSGLLVFAATVFAGAVFPFAVRILVTDPQQAVQGSGQVLGWLFIGAILAVIPANLLLPELGFSESIRVVVLSYVALGVLASFVLSRGAFVRSALTLTVLVLAATLFQPDRPVAFLHSSPVKTTHLSEELYFGVGRSETVLVTNSGDYLELRSQGVPRSSLSRRGAAPVRNQQHWLGLLPVLARSETRDLLMIGLGAGVALEAIPNSVTQVDVIESEAKVLEANQKMAAQRQVDPLQQSRIKFIQNDPRFVLSTTDKQYQTIISQPAYPASSEASHLYTKEFLTLAKSRLSDGGVFVQWMNTRFLNQDLLHTLIATLVDEFPEVRLFRPVPNTLIFLASDTPLNLETYLAQDIAQRGGLRRFGLASIDDLLISVAADTEGLKLLSQGAPVNTDDQNLLALKGQNLVDPVTGVIDELLAPYDPLTNSDSWLYRFFSPNWLYVGGQLNALGFFDRAKRLADSLPVGPERWLINASNLTQDGRPDQAENALRTALQLDSTNQQVRFALLLPQVPSIALGNAQPETEAMVAALTGECVNVINGVKALANQDFAEVVELDTRLGRIAPNSLCYPVAVQIRAEWRLKVDASRQPHMARESLALLDSILATHQSLELFALRAAAAAIIGDNASFVESTIVLARAYQIRLNLAEQRGVTGMRDFVKERLTELSEKLKEMEFGPGYSGRLRVARRLYRVLLASLESDTAGGEPLQQ